MRIGFVRLDVCADVVPGLEDAKREAEKDKSSGMGGIGNVFAAPDVISKIASNPQTVSIRRPSTALRCCY